MRFLPETIWVHVGDTVEWTNIDPTLQHTVTFGTEPPTNATLLGLNAAPIRRSPPGRFLNATSDHLTLNTGLIVAALQDQANQTARRNTRPRDFLEPGTYNYICALHDELGMKGKVVVLR